MRKKDKGDRKEVLIKSINNTLLPKTVLGKYVDKNSVKIMKEHGIDICGEIAEKSPYGICCVGF